MSLNFTPSPFDIPTPAECIAHLKLLHAFAKLRHEVGNQDGLFGIEFRKVSGVLEGMHEANPSKAAARGHTLSEKEIAEVDLAERIREKRWTVFVTAAVDRFEKWWDTLPSHSDLYSSPLNMSMFIMFGASRPDLFPTHGAGMGQDINERLPPLDVLMVWHAYMLNPQAYLEDCMRLSRHQIWSTPFPWELINSSIDSETFEYNPPEAAKHNWESTTDLPWGSIHDAPFGNKYSTVLRCPKCLQNLDVPWTRPPMTSGPETLEAYLEYDTGFAGQQFQESCPSCDLVIKHETLRVGKFISDAEAVLRQSLPLPGTILNPQGIPQMVDPGKGINTHDPFFPNRLIQNAPRWQPDYLRMEIATLSIECLRSRLENVVSSFPSMELIHANIEQLHPQSLGKASRIAIRKWLSHYWDNSSPFGLDLVGAVIRQSSFVLKMRNIDWLHSPAVLTTAQRLIVKYHRFVQIVAENPNKVAVPTLDVDLAWHTHQLSPKIYSSYTLAETKKFLNHDDKIIEGTLHTQFQWTSAQYEKKYGQPYAECACWYCECTREPLRSSFTSKINPFRGRKIADVEKRIENGELGKDPVIGVHISAHNAIRENTKNPSAGYDTSAYQHSRELEGLNRTYGRVLHRYNKKKASSSAPRKKNNSYVHGAYGYPLYYPVYVPYLAEPTCEHDRYTMATGGGREGAGCVYETCSTAASLGSCAIGGRGPACNVGCGERGLATGGGRCGVNCGGGGGGGGGNGGGDGDGGDGGGNGGGGGCGGCGG
ncbi:uncharacterized protein BDR25DRAFT_294736 [Lindgomyces ingoldianus]|uniref:Uncharacterized protein n=1 Tax=Lindgomyces ingoldianus TaxID=673940 RepID=A0ACB6QHU2_9PLEO|nr:uncharacterized protein BDR25DRAFT_294736 [Lindgomyces ingoldianus]KAF2465710.1 hypothetical protein BDR25DRAFT_294736 [Lindgomyces ingoldianus]